MSYIAIQTNITVVIIFITIDNDIVVASLLQILVLIIAIFTLNVYVTNATSLDPTQYVEMGDTKSESGDTRTKRSGDLFTSLLKKKFGLISSLAGSSSGKSIGHSEHYEEPLVSHTSIMDLYNVYV